MAELVSLMLDSRWMYAFTVVLMIIGLYAMLLKHNLVKKLIGMNIFQGSITLFYVLIAYKKGGSVPIWDEAAVGRAAADYMNPIPHGLMLTAIVVSVATTAVGLGLLIVIHREFHTLDEDELLREMRKREVERRLGRRD